MIARAFCFACLTALLFSPGAYSQGIPSLPSIMGGEQESGTGGADSFLNMMRNDLMRRLDEAKQNVDSRGARGRRVERPRPELGGNRASEPLDLSKFLGTEGDQQKAIEKLIENGVLPPSAAGSVPQPTSTDWEEVPLDKRLSYAKDLIERRKPNTAMEEINAILGQDDLNDDLKLDAIILREKALLLLKEYETVQEDYYRLKAYYPEDKRVDELKTYLEAESGLDALQQKVKENPEDPLRQQELLDRYFKLGWLDFAEEYFGSTLANSSEATVKSLGQIYFKKKELDMLIRLSKTAQELYPQAPEFFYNEGVALYARGERAEARDRFMKAMQLSRDPKLNMNINWYLQRIPATLR